MTNRKARDSDAKRKGAGTDPTSAFMLQDLLQALVEIAQVPQGTSLSVDHVRK